MNAASFSLTFSLCLSLFHSHIALSLFHLCTGLSVTAQLLNQSPSQSACQSASGPVTHSLSLQRPILTVRLCVRERERERERGSMDRIQRSQGCVHVIDCAARLARLSAAECSGCQHSVQRLTLPPQTRYQHVRDKSILLLLLSQGRLRGETETLIVDVLRGEEECIASYEESGFTESFFVAIMKRSVTFADCEEDSAVLLQYVYEAVVEMQHNLECTKTLLFLAFLRAAGKNLEVFVEFCCGNLMKIGVNAQDPPGQLIKRTRLCFAMLLCVLK